MDCPEEKSPGYAAQGSSRIPSLDGLRGVSILLIMIEHGKSQVPFFDFIFKYVANGMIGVTTFFILSGYLITAILLKEQSSSGRINIKNFYLRRVLRIFPAFYFYIVLSSSIALLLGYDLDPRDVLVAVFYVTNFAIPAPYWPLAHTWTLSIEEQFYLMWPLIVARANSRLLPVCAFLLMLSAVGRCSSYLLSPSFTTLTLAPFFAPADGLIIGSLLAFLFFKHPNLWDLRLLRSPYLRCLALLAIWLIAHFLPTHLPRGTGLPFRLFGEISKALSIGYLMLSVISVRDDLVFKMLNSRLLVFVGKMSYSLYLWQQMFLCSELRGYGTNDEWWCYFPINFVLAFICGYASYRMVEMPFFHLRDRLPRLTSKGV